MLATLIATLTLTGSGLAGSGGLGDLMPQPDFSQETPAERDKRMKWFREARFGMFIHWGLYAIPAGVWKGRNYPGAAEWLLNTAQIKVADYLPLLPQFNPVKFNAMEWVRIAKDAGMKYLVITSKHHDGFALWHSKQSEWDVESTPFKRDILRELAAACKEAGIIFGLYHSIMDWHHPDYLPRRAWDPRPEHKADFDNYVRYMKAQLKEIVEGYGPAVLWFDGEWENTWTHERGVDLYHYVRSLKPDILVNNRVDKGRAGMAGMTVGDHMGDFGTPEQEIPPNGFPGVDWESCMTMNDTWGFHQNDPNWKSERALIENLVDCASKGGNYLLNVGPTALGEIPAASVDRLAVMGRWLRANGEAIYGSTASPFPKPLKWGRVTSKPGKLYIHVFGPNLKEVVLPGLTANVKSIYPLGKPAQKLASKAGPDGLIVALPEVSELVPVYVMEYTGELKIAEMMIAQAADGTVLLEASDAGVKGHTARYEVEKKAIGFWTNAADKVAWTFQISKPGRFRVELDLACEPGNEGSGFTVALNDAMVSSVVPATKSWSDFTRVSVGEFELPHSGKFTLTVGTDKIAKFGLMNIRSVRLRPV
mgnify:FL=1